MTLQKIIDYAVGIAEPEMIILFGSMANGMINSFSDVDLLIISENTWMKKDIIAKIVSYSSELSLKIDVLIYSRSEIEKKSQKSNSFIAAIIKSGKVVYKNN
jgi:predicted nucleotidyltransferase